MFRFTNLIIFELTRDCNLNCKYCYVQDKYKFKGEIIDFELYKKIVDKIVLSRINNNKREEELKIVFHGGECTLLGPVLFEKYVDYFNEKLNLNKLSYNFGIQTNGTLLSEDWIPIFQKYNISLSISFDGYKEENPKRFNDSNLLQSKVCNTIVNMSQYVPVRVLSVIGKSNFNDFYLNFKKDSPFYDKDIHWYTSFLKDSKFSSYKGEIVSSEDFVSFFSSFFKEDTIDYALENFIYLKLLFFNILLLLISNKYIDYDYKYYCGCDSKFCGSGINMIAIKPDGRVPYCDRFDINYDWVNIYHALDYDFLGLNQIRHSLKMSIIKDSLLKEKGCDKCRLDSICDHDCLSMSYSKYGEFKCDYSICNRYKGIYRYMKKNLPSLLDIILHNRNRYSVELTGGKSIVLNKSYIKNLQKKGFFISTNTVTNENGVSSIYLNIDRI